MRVLKYGWVLLLMTGVAEVPAEMRAMFNGKDFAGWHIRPGGQWTIEEGVIVGRIDKAEKRHGMLVSDAVYTDFRVRFEFRCARGDSGFYFRTKEVENHVAVRGFQVEADASMETGGLYETGGRGWVVKPDAALMKEIYTPGAWTRMELEAVGPKITVRVNGRVVTEITDEKSAREGRFGLQLHGGMDMEVRFRGVMIEALEPLP